MIKKDYRNTEFCNELKKIEKKKQKLKAKIKNQRPRTRIYYNAISNYYRDEFLEMYNGKCSYCGVSYEVIGKMGFEIDHYIPESFFNGDLTTAGKIENLVLSCKSCNRKKSNFFIPQKYERLLKPDLKTIKKIFYRSTDFKIKIKPRHLKNKKINEFYEKLLLGDDFRRLDYMALRLKKMLEGLPPEKLEEKSILLSLYFKIINDRNNSYF